MSDPVKPPHVWSSLVLNLAALSLLVTASAITCVFRDASLFHAHYPWFLAFQVAFWCAALLAPMGLILNIRNLIRGPRNRNLGWGIFFNALTLAVAAVWIAWSLKMA